MHVLQCPAALFIAILSYNHTDKRKEMSGLSDRDYHDAIIEATPPVHFGLKYNRKITHAFHCLLLRNRRCQLIYFTSNGSRLLCKHQIRFT